MSLDPPSSPRAVPASLDEALAQIRALEAELRDARDRFSSLVDDLAYGYFVSDLSGTVVEANRCAEQITGYRAEEHPSFLELILPEDLERAAADLALVATAPNAGPRCYQIRRADGAIRHVEINTVPLRRGDEIVAFHGTARDVTDQRQAEVALLESEQRFRELADLLPGVIYEYDLAGRFTYTNRHAFELSGYSESELERGISVLELLVPDERTAAMSNMMRLAAGEGPVRGEYQLVRKDGTRIPVEAHSTPIRKGGVVVGVRGMLHDLTAIRASEQARRQLEAQILQAQKLESLGLLAGGLAHDFNNLLQVILGNASLALSRPESQCPQRFLLEGIRTAARHAKDLTGQMLAYSGGEPAQLGPLDLNQVVADLEDLVTASLPKTVTLRLDLATSATWIDAETTQIQQVLLNLVSNAAEAHGAEAGSVTIRTAKLQASTADLLGAIGTELLTPGTYALLEVSDTGCGMTEETRKRIFDPFYSTKFPGRGLGLAAAFGIVRGHRGALQVESALGKGSRFRVLLPLTDPPSQGSVVSSDMPIRTRRSGILLLVDDERAVRESSSLILEEAGYTVIAASDGEKALEVFAERGASIAAVLLDLSMPRRDGFDTFQDLRRIAPQLPIILSSGHAEQVVAERFRDLGVTAFLKKPYESAELIAVVGRILGRSSTSLPTPPAPLA